MKNHPEPGAPAGGIPLPFARGFSLPQLADRVKGAKRRSEPLMRVRTAVFCLGERLKTQLYVFIILIPTTKLMPDDNPNKPVFSDDNPHKPVFSKIRQVATSRQIAMDSAEDSKMFRYLQVDQKDFCSIDARGHQAGLGKLR